MRVITISCNRHFLHCSLKPVALHLSLFTKFKGGLLPNSKPLFSEADIISSYTRADAIQDGILVVDPIEALRREAGIKYHCAMTAELFEAINPNASEKMLGQDLEGRVWDMLVMFRMAVRKAQNATTIPFSFIVRRKKGPRGADLVIATAQCGPGDAAEPVITFMLEAIRSADPCAQ